ncbi:MAG: leucine-rich repeat domain-containing protein, partial [Acholeplasmatales bacterium]|nr:leucine-rich repeat domain-containing protein [Acholeplasmatales bacterium]
MRNKITKLFSIVIAVLACASCFADPNSPSHNEHTYGDWLVEREASCIDEGIERRYCECGVSEERFTGFKEHNYREDFVQEGSCNQVGFIRYSCDRCGDSYHEDTGMGQHVYATLEIVNPSCQQDGYIRYICHGCGSTFDDVLKPEECTFNLKNEYEGTCMEQGYLVYVCDKNPDHTYIEYTGEYGEHQYNVWQYGDCHIYDSCYMCYEPHPQQGQYVPHEFTDWNIDYEASCFNNGSKSKTCKDCNYYYYENIDPTHSFEEGICVMCQDHEPTDGLIYQKLNDYECAVVGINQQSVDKLVIPNIYKGLYVTEIKTNAFNGKSINSIVLPKSMKTFRNNAFFGIAGLTNVYYSASLSDWFAIDFAYTDSNNIYSTPAAKGVTIHFLDENNEYYAPTNLVIPSDVTIINRFKFANFEQLTSVTFHDNIEYIAIGAFYNCSNLDNITIKAKEIDNMAFGNCESLTSVTIGEGLRKLPAGMFIYNESLLNVDLPESLEEISDSAFMGCTSLTNIEIPDNVKVLGAGVFYNCSSLQNATLPNSLQSIDGYMFYGCDNLNYNEIDGALYLGSKNNPKLMLINYTNTEVETYTVDSAVRVMEQEAISGCDNLVELIVPETVLDYVPHLIRNCAMLTRITIPYYNLGSIGDIFNWNRYNLEYICINGGEIGNREAFSNYPELKEIYISDNVEIYDSVYLTNLPKLEKLTIPYFDSNYIGSLDYIIDNNISLKYLNILNSEQMSIDFLEKHPELEEVYLPDNLKIVNDSVYNIDRELNFNEYENGLYLGSKNNPYLLLVSMIDEQEENFVVHPDVQVALSNGNFIHTEIDDVWYLGTTDNPYKYVYFDNSYPYDNCEIVEGAEIILSTNNTNFSNYNTLTLPSTIKEIRCNFGGNASGYNQVLYYNGSLIDWSNIKFYSTQNNPMYTYDELYYKPNSEGEYIKLSLSCD